MTGIVHLSGGPPRTRESGDVLRALEEALAAADPARLVAENLTLDGGALHIRSLRLNLPDYRRVLVIGGGKASGKMALGLEQVLGDRITAGSVNVPDYLKLPKSPRIAFNPSTHPTPSSKGVRGARKMLELVGKPSRRDLVICLLSGGASALVPLPLPGVSIEDKAELTGLLLRSGADIHEINAVRKHISAIKGGRLAESLYPATVVSLIISDVVGDRIDTVSSGLTAPDPTTYLQAKKVLVRRRLWDRASPSIRATIDDGVRGRIKETPKPGSRIFRRVKNIVIGNNRRSRLRAGLELRARGYRTRVLSREVTGEARVLGLKIGREMKRNGPQGAPWALVGGGETVVTVKGSGSGGRNQEFALSVALQIQGTEGLAFGSMATDGLDGPTDAAGAMADGGTIERARNEGLRARRALAGNDSYAFFKKLGALIITGPTGTNVNDVFVALGRPMGRGPRAPRTWSSGSS